MVNVELAAEQILDHGELPEYIRVFPCRDTEEYEFRYDTTVTGSGYDENVAPKYGYGPSDYLDLYEALQANPRDATPNELHLSRIDEEMSFFDDENHLDLLLSIKSLIDTFKRDGIVWGVGRGSSCASYVLYLLEVHDVNPISYEINFSEFSKQ